MAIQKINTLVLYLKYFMSPKYFFLGISSCKMKLVVVDKVSIYRPNESNILICHVVEESYCLFLNQNCAWDNLLQYKNLQFTSVFTNTRIATTYTLFLPSLQHVLTCVLQNSLTVFVKSALSLFHAEANFKNNK